MQFPEGYHAEVLGEYAAREESQNRLLALGLLSLLGIMLVLHVDFGSARLVSLVALTLPFALIGGVAAAFLSGGVLSLGSLVGFVTVLGIAARNGIMLVSHYRHLDDVEGVPFGRELVERGAEERLAPILMTALATGLALVPMVPTSMRNARRRVASLADVDRHALPALACNAPESKASRSRREVDVARRRFQSGWLFKSGKRRKVWVGRWREDALMPDGTIGEIHRSLVLGLVVDIPTRREAQLLLDAKLLPVN